MTIGIDTPVLVPSNFSGLEKDLFDVQYFANSNDPVAASQNFTFNLTNFSDTHIEIDLFFSHPLYVSVDTTLLDEIVVRFYKTFFATTISSGVKDRRDMRWDYNDTAPRSDYIELKQVVPPQLGSETEAQVLDAVKAVMTAGLVGSFALPLALQIALKSAMNKVWSVFNTLQILQMLPLMAISFPGNVTTVFDQIDKIMQLDFIPKDQIYEFVFGESLEEVSSNELKDLVLEKAGFSKDDMFKSIFLVGTGLVLLLLLSGLTYLVYKKTYSRLPESYRKIFASIKNKLLFNSVLRLLLQSYLPLCVSAMVSLNYATRRLQSTSGLILIIALALCPIGVVYVLTKKRLVPIAHPHIKAKIGTLYLNVETYGKKFALLFTPLFLVRRLLFAMIVVTVKENALLQIYTTMHVSLVLVYFYAVVWPMNDTVNNVLQLLNEIFFLLCSYFLLAFTEYTVDPVERHDIGTAFLALLAVNVVANVALIAYNFVKQARDYCEERKAKAKAKDAIKHREAISSLAFKNKRNPLVVEDDDLEQNNRSNNEDPNLRSEGSLRSPGPPLPPSLLEGPGSTNQAQLQVAEERAPGAEQDRSESDS